MFLVFITVEEERLIVIFTIEVEITDWVLSVVTIEEEGLPMVFTVDGKGLFSVGTVGVEGSLDGDDPCELFAFALPLTFLVVNCPVTTMVTTVITVILVFWVQKRQMGGNMVNLCIHLFDLCIWGNYRQRVMSTLLSEGRMPDLNLPTKIATHHPTQTTYCTYTMGMSNNSSLPITVRTLSILLLPCSPMQLLISPCFH